MEDLALLLSIQCGCSFANFPKWVDMVVSETSGAANALPVHLVG